MRNNSQHTIAVGRVAASLKDGPASVVRSLLTQQVCTTRGHVYAARNAVCACRQGVGVS